MRVVPTHSVVVCTDNSHFVQITAKISRELFESYFLEISVTTIVIWQFDKKIFCTRIQWLHYAA